MAGSEVVAIANFSGEVGELSFKKGDTIKVLEKVDHNWSKGRIGTAVGIFPVNFVVVKRSRPGVPPLPRSSPRPHSSPRGSPHRSKGLSKTLGRGYSPRTDSPRRNATVRDDVSPKGSPLVNGVNRKVQPCARALFTFTGEKKGELSFSEGVKIRLLRRIDDNWLEGELNGVVGIFPQSFVKISVGLPSKVVESDLADSGKPYARALCNFPGDSRDDLSFERNDLIELLSWAGEGWMKGRSSNNKVGVFPASFVHVIQPLPMMDDSPRGPPSVVVSSPSPIGQAMPPHPKPRKTSASSAPSNVTKPVPRKRASPGVPKRSAPCPPGLRSPRQPHERSRPRTPDFDSSPSTSMRLLNHRPVTMASSMYNSSHHGDMSTVDSDIPKPRKRINSVAVSAPMDQTSLGLQMEELQSKLALEQKMLHSAEALLKVTTTPDKQCKLEGSIAEHQSMVTSLQQQLQELMAEQREQFRSKTNTVLPRPPPPSREDPELAREMMRQKRLDELLETERVYLNDMMICYHDIMPALAEINGLDVKVMFGNLGDVVKVTEELLKGLEENKLTVGKTFNKYSSHLCTTYGVYCRNNESAMSFLEKYLENPDLSSKIQTCFNKAMPENDSHSWDLSSLIIKPIQRITKYPLLIGELLKVTDEQHPDWSHLQKAYDAMIAANSRINEFKRRKDLVVKYTGGAESSIGSRISLHSVRKKMTRVKQSITQRTGLRHKTVDAKFDEEDGLYMESEALVKGVYRVTLAWGEQLQETWKALVNLAQDVQEAWSDDEHESVLLMDSYHGTVNKAMQDKLKLHLAHVQDHVIHPLQQLLTLFQGPSTLIGKRKDKLLDYDHLQHALEKTKDKEPDKLKQLNEQCTAAKRNYEALNTQLLEELPLFRVKVAKMVSRTIAVFLRAQNQLYLEWAGLLQSLTSSDEGVGLVELHTIQLQEACQQLTQLSVVPSWLGSHAVKSPSSTRSLLLAPTHYSAVTLPAWGAIKSNIDVTDGNHSSQKRPQVGHLYLALYSFDAQDAAELSVAKGDNVVLVTPHDQLGSSEWWLVAKGNTEGYVPSVYLELMNEDEASHDEVHKSPERSPVPKQRSKKLKEISPKPMQRSSDLKEKSPDADVSSPEPLQSSPDLKERSPDADVSSPEPQDDDAMDESLEGRTRLKVLYTFDAGSDVELSVEEGQWVWLLESHDLTGNSEWWLVQREDGTQGFVPANYL